MKNKVIVSGFLSIFLLVYCGSSASNTTLAETANANEMSKKDTIEPL